MWPSGWCCSAEPNHHVPIPLVLGKIYKTISEGANKKGYVFKKVLDFCYNYKLWWNIWGIQTKVFDMIIFNKLKIFLVAGWTILSKEEHLMHPKLKNVCENSFARLFPRDTMTETKCGGTWQVLGELSVGNIGGPMAGMEVRLMDWEEGKFRFTGKRYPTCHKIWVFEEPLILVD